MQSTRTQMPLLAARERLLLFWYRARRILFNGILLVLVATGAFFFVVPFAWMVSTAGKETALIFKFPPVWIPPQYRWSNFIESWDMLPFGRFYLNTIKVTLLSVFGVLLSSSIVAFAFARLRFPGRDVLFLMLLGTMMLPGQVTMIPQYILYSKLGWVNKHIALYAQSWLGDAFSIFLLRQFYMTISPELDDAARIDGCSRLGIFLRIILPLARPALAVVAIFQFTFMWNNFFRPLIYIDSIDLFPVALGLRLFQDQTTIELQYMMAQTVLFMLPLLVLFFLAQRHFIQGIVVTGVKG
jgi:ABC-type glycerol-3-phosphate transport system permease component